MKNKIRDFCLEVVKLLYMAKSSRMAKLLKKIKQDGDLQEDRMSKRDKIASVDMEAGLNDIRGEVSVKKLAQKESDNQYNKQTDRMQDLFKNLKPVDDYAQKTNNLDKLLEKTWICYPLRGKLISRELADCTRDEFLKWLVWVYPPAKRLDEDSKTYYDKASNRYSAFARIIQFFSGLSTAFKEGNKNHLMTEQTEGQSRKKKAEQKK